MGGMQGETPYSRVPVHSTYRTIRCMMSSHNSAFIVISIASPTILHFSIDTIKLSLSRLLSTIPRSGHATILDATGILLSTVEDFPDRVEPTSKSESFSHNKGGVSSKDKETHNLSAGSISVLAFIAFVSFLILIVYHQQSAGRKPTLINDTIV